jgi:small GTP-binding protein
LILSDNQLEKLPLGVTLISKLYELDLSCNGLEDLPSEIVRLSALRNLNLSFTQIRTLPSEFSCLKNLRILDLSYTQITKLSTEVTELVNLTALNLSVNRLKMLPPEIGRLDNLRTLDLHDNQLSGLPLEIGRLQWLITLDLTGNPLPSLPPEIREAGCSSVINFYRQQLEQDTERLYEAKLLIIGEGGAGKTTLLNKICNPNYKLKPSESSTKGIDIVEWSFPVGDGKQFKVNIWDFGGQEIYHATHQFFLTKRSLYALVADSRKEDTDFYYWLNVVELLSDSSPLLIVSNEKEDRKRDINERQLRGEFTNLKEILPANLATNRGLVEILSTVKKYICGLSHIGTELPRTWVKVREALERDSRNYISLEEYLALCELYGFINLKDKLQLSEYLHDLGICLHFQEDDLLFKTIVLKPTWGTDAVYKVLDNPVVIQNRGKFNRNELDEIWHEPKYTTMRAELLRLMMNFKLCYEIPSCPGVYIAPELLDPSQPSYSWDDNDNLLLRYEYEFMPKGILTRFIVEIKTPGRSNSITTSNSVS